MSQQMLQYFKNGKACKKMIKMVKKIKIFGVFPNIQLQNNLINFP